MKKSLLVLTCLTFLFNACNFNRLYDKNEDIPDYVWNKDNKLSFEVPIEDTAALYNIYVNIRHTTLYQYSNMWIDIYTHFPDGETKEKRVELELANKEGKWYGDCLGDICDLRVPIQENAFFEQPGTYRFEYEQIMRMDDLPFVMSMGLRVEKAGER